MQAIEEHRQSSGGHSAGDVEAGAPQVHVSKDGNVLKFETSIDPVSDLMVQQLH